MNNRNALLSFGILILLFAFTFVFCLDALSIPNLTYGILALIGYIICISFSLFMGGLSRKQGESIAIWFTSYGIAVSIVFVWYLTRCGTAFNYW
jgi:hypothetical protein